MKSKILNVLYQSDDNYAMVSGISIASLLENNTHLNQINIYYCSYMISVKNIERLQALCAHYENCRLSFIDANAYHEVFIDLDVKPWHGVYVTWLKLLAIGDIRLDTDRILFMNGHTIINGQLDELIEIDFNGMIMALSYDGLVNEHKRTIGLADEDGYYNCGIMLINHKKWIDESIEILLKKHLREKSDYVIADQDLCNVVFRGKIKTLSSTYNFSSAYYAYDLRKFLKINSLHPPYFYSYEELMADYYSPKIIHSLFGVQGKPWEDGNLHPQRFLWKKYLDITPWKDEKMPIAKVTLTWRLYRILPKWLFMQLYISAVRRKFGRV